MILGTEMAGDRESDRERRWRMELRGRLIRPGTKEKQLQVLGTIYRPSKFNSREVSSL